MAYDLSRLPATALDDRPSARTLSTHAMHANNDSRDSSASTPVRHLVLWIDGVGGYLLWDKAEVVLGQAFAESRADVGITGDLSRQAAAVRRIGSDYLLQPLQETRLNGVAIDRPQLLRDASVVELGKSVKVRFRKPNALSGTARLEMASIHRWKPNVDAVVLMADCCIVGPRSTSHIVCPQWRNELLLVQKAGQWQMRIAEEVQVNGQRIQGQFPIAAGIRVRGEDFSLSIE